MCPCPGVDDAWTNELEDFGYTVLYAEEPIQGLVHVRTGVVDIVVIDGASGDDPEVVADFVQRLEAEPFAPPFVLVSSSPSAPSDSARLGAAAFVPKPCAAVDLQHVFTRMSVQPRQPLAATL